MKLTAVECMVEQLTAIGQLEIPKGSNAVTLIIEQAKAMEKEQMCKFAYKCHKHYKVYGDFKIEQYYNETFKPE